MKKLSFIFTAIFLFWNIGARADLIKQSTAYNRTVLMTQSSDHVTGLAGLTLTIKLSADGGAFATITPTVTDLGNGRYKLALTTTHTATLGALDLYITGTSADPTDTHDQVVAFDPSDGAALGLSRIDTATSTRSAPSTAQTIDQTTVIPTSPTANTLGEAFYYASQRFGRRNTAQGGTSNTITLDAGASSTDDLFKNYLVKVATGTGSGQFRTCTGYVGSTKVLAVYPVWTIIPDNTSTYWIEPMPYADVLQWSGSTVNALISGRVDSNAQVVGDKTAYSLSQAFPSFFSALAITAGGAVTAGTVSDKTGYSLAQAFPGNFSSLAITGGGAVTAGTVADKTGYSLTQTFPANFSSFAISGGGAVTAGTVNDKTGYSLAQAFPSFFSALDINASGQLRLQPTQTGVTIPTVTTVTNATPDSAGVGTLLTRVGTPAVSVSADIAALPSNTSIATATQTGLTAQGVTTARAGYLDKINTYLDATISSRLATSGYTAPSSDISIAADVQTGLTAQGYTTVRAPYLNNLSAGAVALHTDYTALSTLLGTPAGASVSADLVAIEGHATSTDSRLTAARAGYLDYLNIGGLVSTQASVNALPSAASIASAVLAGVIDASGTTPLTFRQSSLVSTMILSGHYTVSDHNTTPYTRTTVVTNLHGDTIVTQVTHYYDSNLQRLQSRDQPVYTNMP